MPLTHVVSGISALKNTQTHTNGYSRRITPKQTLRVNRGRPKITEKRKEMKRERDETRRSRVGKHRKIELY